MDILVPDSGRVDFNRRLFGFSIGGREMVNVRSGCLALTVPENVRADWARVLVRLIDDETFVLLNETHGCATGWPETEKDADRYWPDDARALKAALLVNQKVARGRLEADEQASKSASGVKKSAKP